MADDTTHCIRCGRDILRSTAERRSGLCAPCHRNAQKPPEVLLAERVFERIDAAVSPFTTYETALKKLRSLPLGYSLCFAFQYVNADIANGGVSQLYSNSTWPLILDAEQAAREAGAPKVAALLREIVYYYHLKGRSRLTRCLPDEYFASMPSAWNKSLKQLDEAYAGLEDDAGSVILRLCRERQDLLAES